MWAGARSRPSAASGGLRLRPSTSHLVLGPARLPALGAFRRAFSKREIQAEHSHYLCVYVCVCVCVCVYVCVSVCVYVLSDDAIIFLCFAMDKTVHPETVSLVTRFLRI